MTTNTTPVASSPAPALQAEGLLPCPAGHIAIAHKIKRDDDLYPRGWYYVDCVIKECGWHSGGWQTAAEAIAAWNTRTPPPQEAPAPATEGAQREAVALAPIESNEFYKGRFYIPLPGGWEIQTKGSGSSFRICNTKDGERINVSPQPYLYETLEQMAREVHAAWNTRTPPPDLVQPERVEADSFTHKRNAIFEREMSIPFEEPAPPTDASGGVTDDQVEQSCKAAYSACDMGPFPEQAVDPVSDRRFVRATLEAADRARKPDTSAQAASAGEPVGYVSSLALDELSRLGRVGTINLWNRAGEFADVPLYTAPAPVAAAWREIIYADLYQCLRECQDKDELEDVAQHVWEWLESIHAVILDRPEK